MPHCFDGTVYIAKYGNKTYTYKIHRHSKETIYYTVNLNGEDIEFFHKKAAKAAIERNIADIMWKGAPEIYNDSKSLDAIIEFINDNKARKQWFFEYIRSCSGSYWYEAVIDILKEKTSKAFEKYDEEIKQFFIRMCEKVLTEDFIDEV